MERSREKLTREGRGFVGGSMGGELGGVIEERYRIGWAGMEGEFWEEGEEEEEWYLVLL
jgi:hypothetical protein